MYEGPIQELTTSSDGSRGPKSAQRIAFYLLQTDKADVEKLTRPW